MMGHSLGGERAHQWRAGQRAAVNRVATKRARRQPKARLGVEHDPLVMGRFNHPIEGLLGELLTRQPARICKSDQLRERTAQFAHVRDAPDRIATHPVDRKTRMQPAHHFGLLA